MKFCPQCHLLLERVEREGAAFWACRNCGGCWFAESELHAALSDDRTCLNELDRLFPGIASADIFTGLPRPCPDCRTIMLERRPLDRASSALPAEPLTCHVCGGVWLEPGEPGLRKQADAALPPERADRIEAQVPTADTESVADAGPVEAEPEPARREEAILPLPVVELPAADQIAPPFVVRTAPAGGASGQAVEEPAAAATPAGPFTAPLATPGETPGPLSPPIVLPAMTSAIDTLPAAPEPAAQTPPDVRPGIVAESREHPVLLTGEPMPTPPVIRHPAKAERWCPQCRQGFTAGVSACPDCRIGLAEGAYRIRCLRCNGVNIIAAERCWHCQADLHPPELAQPRPPTARLPDDSDVARFQRAKMHEPPGPGSCFSAALEILVKLFLGLLQSL